MASQSHEAIATTAKGVLEHVQLRTHSQQDDEVLVSVEFASLVAFDTWITDSAYFISESSYPLPLGLNAAGTIIAIGPNVDTVQVGDRVATFARADEARGKATQQAALLSKYSVAKIPDSLNLAEAATIPDNFVTAYFTLFDNLRLPVPTSLPAVQPPAEKDTPILIYGSGTTVGQYLIQLLRLTGYKRILTTASAKHHEHLLSLGATDVFDYSQSNLSDQILASTHGQSVKYVVDCVAAESTSQQIAKVVGKGSIVSILLPIKEGATVTGTPGGAMWMEFPKDRNPFPEGVELVGTKTFTYQNNLFMKENLMPKILPQLLANKLIQPSRVRLFQDGTFKERAEEALDLIRHNKISGEKAIIRVGSS